MKSFYSILLLIALYMGVDPATAQNRMPQTSGFSGYVEVLGAYISTDSQFNTDSENSKNHTPFKMIPVRDFRR
jgi:hypothetical protein